jgi:hypothetical protein
MDPYLMDIQLIHGGSVCDSANQVHISELGVVIKIFLKT